MYGYAGSSATASQLLPFDPPPQTTDPAAAAGQAAAVNQATSSAASTSTQALPQVTQALPQLMSALPQSLQSLASPASAAAPTSAAADPPSLLTTLNSFITGPLSPGSLFTIPGVPYLFGAQMYLLPQSAVNLHLAAAKVASLPASAGGGLAGAEVGPQLASAPVSAGIGRAGLVGGLSVPQGWASAAPAIKTVVATLPEGSLNVAPAALASDGEGNLFGSMTLSGLAGRAMVGTGGAAARSAGIGTAAAVGEATTANIFVIPEAAE